MKEINERINKRFLRWLLASYATLPPAALLLLEGILKEMPLFWRNEGGYPVLFRHWVLYSFYPAFFMLFAWLCLLTSGLLKHRQHAGRLLWLAMLPLGISWLLLFATGITVITDNLQNLWHGDALHAPRGIGPD